MVVDYISKHIPLNEKDRQQIAACLERKVFSKGEILLREGGYEKSLYFLEQGFVRSFYLKDNGNEKTHWIYGKHDFFTAWYSFFTGKPSFEALEAIDQSHIYSISQSNYQLLYKKNAAFNTFINTYYQHLIAEMDYLTKTFVHLSAKDKYRYVLEKNPEMVQQLKLGMLASLLDISQETLSRVRRQF
ncbi:MAG: Crp/Fnr family transcriptional regulator [Bacteroidota bacterium]